MRKVIQIDKLELPNGCQLVVSAMYDGEDYYPQIVFHDDRGSKLVLPCTINTASKLGEFLTESANRISELYKS